MLLNLYPPAESEKEEKLQRRRIVKEIKTLTAVIHTANGKDETEVAEISDISVGRLEHMKRTPRWAESFEWYTGKPYRPPVLTASEGGISTPRPQHDQSYRDKKHVLYFDQDGICGGCRCEFHIQMMTFDHIVPKAKGGTNDLGNLQLLCYYCNNLKSDKPQSYLLEKLKDEGFDVSPDNSHWSNRLRRFGARAVYAGFSFLVSFCVMIQP